MDPTLSQEEREKAIKEWVDGSIEVLLSQNEDGKLTVVKGIMTASDYLQLSSII